MSTPSKPKPWSRILNEEENKLGRALAGGHIPSLAKAFMEHEQLRSSMLKLFLEEINRECQALCSKLQPSLFRKIPTTQLLDFQWEGLISDLQNGAPTLLKILSSVVVRNDH